MKTRNMRSFLVLAALICACGGKSNKTTTAGMDRIKIGYLPMVSSLTYFVATEQGYFRDENLAVEASSIKTSNGLAQELQKGQIDLAVELSVVPLLQYSTDSPPFFKIFSISAIDAVTAFDGILVKDGSNISSFQDLSGKKIATFPGTTSKASILHVFKTRFPNLPPPNFETNIKLPDQLNALTRGEVDAVHAYEPLLTIGLIKHKLKNAGGSIYAAQLDPNPIGVAAVTTDILNMRPEVAQKAIRAFDKAVDFIKSHPAESRRILAKYTSADSDICEKMQIMPMSQSTHIDVDNLQAYFDLLRTIGEHKNSQKAIDMVISRDFAK